MTKNLNPAGTIRRISLLLPVALASGAAPPKEPPARTWDFESDEPGKIAKGFTNEVGRWVVAQDGQNRVLAQKAENDDDTFNVALAESTSYKDLDLSVRLKAVA